ncbi:MAG: hypothetical protein HY784_16950, partial [Chloroflexi bacterium]|nr:hypothetical protein [Chloroflexota bacterium]
PLTWTGGYFLFMGTRWVKSIRYFLPIYPFLALFAAWAIAELWSRASRPASAHRREASRRGASRFTRRLLAGGLFAVVLLGTLLWAWGFVSAVYRQENTRIRASRWIYQNIPAPLDLHINTASGPYNEPLSMPPGTPIGPATPYRTQFQPRVSGTLTGISLGHARNPNDPATGGTLHITLSADPGGTQVLGQADLIVTPVGETQDPRGERLEAALGPVALEKGTTYYLSMAAADGGPLQVSGATVANESWDEGLPLRIDGRDGFGGLYQGLTMEVRWLDDENKHQMYLERLAQVDYIILPSQRGIWSTSRLPMTYPMTLEYYRALFDGRLGFELAGQFQAPWRFGRLQISDVGGALAWGATPNLPLFNNIQFAAEEAFSVYDHAPVWIFRKRADFNLENARAILNAVDLSTAVNLGPVDATRTPTLLRLPPDRLAEQRAGGTWSQMFDANGLLNRAEPLGVAAWWLTLLLLGWAAFPLAFVAFGGLPDRGYPLAKTVSLLVVAWLVWMAGSFRLLPFTRETILLGCLALAAISALLGWLRRAELLAYLRAHRRHILIVEGVTLALFLFDLLIRLGNPDLWHPYFGGEKPMVFSFFNAVLKSTSFPPYSPWLAGYQLNYYYYGFVLVGIPVKLLGIVPSFGYNLVLPTLFALAGINAFCVAYNLVEAGRRKKEGGRRKEEGGKEVRKSDASADVQSPQVPAVPSPYHPNPPPP